MVYEKEDWVEVRMRGRITTGASDGVASYVRVRVSGLCSCKDYGRPVVEEVRGSMEGERVVSALLPENFEEFDILAIGDEDVK